jgi:hypothetical protein
MTDAPARGGMPVMRATTILRLLLACCAVLVALTALPVAAAAREPGQGVAKGLVEARLDYPLRALALAGVSSDHDELGAGWVRLNAFWSELEPRRGVYSHEELARLDRSIAAVRGDGVHVLLTVYDTPRWASDRRWWSKPVPGLSRGYRSMYAVERSALPRLQALAALLATRYAGRVDAMECWNEPNFWWFLYPQRTARDPYFGARTYLRMLRAFSAGVRGSGSGVLVLGGATMSSGRDDRYRTSPQRFARFLRRNGAAALIDAYSHHPYVPGCSRNVAPSSRPDRPRYTVTLGNLGALLRLFPTMPFYLTEYGYNTRPSDDFAGFAVSERTQARYLVQAYAQAARYAQVEALFWYLAVDQRPPRGLPADHGVYTGLSRPNGAHKPSWSAYRGL